MSQNEPYPVVMDDLNPTDGQLLRRYLRDRSDHAFEAIVQRFGPMVLGVCMRVLQNPHDADDAFQATFLVLFRKADTVKPPELVGNWLYGVAVKTAHKLRGRTAKQQARERQIPEGSEPATVPAEREYDLQQILDVAVSSLPPKYRIPLVLCELQGKTYKEVARQLGVTVNVVSVRLIRARTMLAERLARRGVTTSVGMLVVVLSQVESAAEPSATLVSSTVNAVRRLAAGEPTASAVSPEVHLLVKGVVNDMFLAKLKTTAAIGLVAAAIGGGLVYQMLVSDAGPITVAGESHVVSGPAAGTENSKSPEDPQKSDSIMLRGTWIAIAAEFNGKKFDAEEEVRAKKIVLTFADDRVKLSSGDSTVFEGTLKIDPDQSVKEMDWLGILDPNGRKEAVTMPGIYRLDGDTLTYCYGLKRPKELKPNPDRALDERMYVFKRVKT